MKTSALPLLRHATLAATLMLAAPYVCARGEDDRAAQLLTVSGSIPIKAVGPYEEVGTFRIQVETKLGRPDARLSNDTWLYHGRSVAGSTAQGTVVIRFNRGRVSTLSLVSPAGLAALLRTVATEQAGRLAANQ